MDNLNFALEKMNLELREGVNISVDSESIQFERLGGGTFCYKKDSLDERETLVKCAGQCSSCDDSKDMLSEGLSLNDLNLMLFKDPSDYKARIMIGVKGEAKSGSSLTDFYIQTTASQRTNDPT